MMKFEGGFGKRRRCRRQEQRQMEEGNSYKITGYRGQNCDFRRKLMNLGLLRGEDFHVMGRAPMGDPIEIKINGYRLSIRENEADELILEKVKNEK
jgi:ferrous iron transport protein A